MIHNFRHKGLKQLFESGISAGVNPQQVPRLRRILALLETAETLDDMDLPGLNLHELKGERKGTWSVKVSGNWRVTFKIKQGDAIDVNYEDYH
jgi:proteic killer suppression protein